MTGLNESMLRSGKGTEGVIERRVRFNYRQREALGGYLFILPWIFGLVIFIAYPIVASLYYSFTDYQVVLDPVWIGTQNYERLIRDEFFWQAMKVTTIYVAVS